MSRNIPPESVSIYDLLIGLGLTSTGHGNMGMVNSSAPYWIGTSYLKTTDATEFFTQSGYPYDTADNLWLEIQNVNGSLTHLPNSRGVRLSIDGTVNAVYERQTAQNFIYSAGNYNEATWAGRVVLQEGRFANMGVGDADNGMFFHLTKTNGEYAASLIRRSKASGSVVEEEIPQELWNLDPLDGTGPSGLVADWEKIQMYYLGHAWYGAGSARAGLTIGDVCHMVHRFEAGNRLEEPILGEPSLPLEVIVQAEPGASVVAEESFVELWGSHFAVLGSDPANRKGYPRSAERLPIAVTQGNTYHLLSIRPQITYKGLPNKSWMRLIDFHLFGNAEGIFRILYNATPTAANWQPLYTGNQSFMEVENTATTFSSEGLRFYSGGATASKGGTTVTLPDFRDPLTPLSNGTSTNSMSIAFVCTGNGSIGATINHEEIY